MATKDDLKNLATKKDLDQTEKRLTQRIDKVDGNVIDVKRRIDLEHDQFVGFRPSA